MSDKFELMKQQKAIAKAIMENVIDPNTDCTHEIESHALAAIIYRIDRNRNDGITKRDRVVTYSYILKQIEEGALNGVAPEDFGVEVTKIFAEAIDDQIADEKDVVTYGLGFSGVTVVMVELLEVLQAVSNETDGSVFKDAHGLAVEALADYIYATRNSEELYELKEEIERLA